MRKKIKAYIILKLMNFALWVYNLETNGELSDEDKELLSRAHKWREESLAELNKN